MVVIKHYITKEKRLAEYTTWNNMKIITQLMKRYPGAKPSKTFAFQLEDDLTAKGASKASIRVYLYAVKL